MGGQVQVMEYACVSGNFYGTLDEERKRECRGMVSEKKRKAGYIN